MNDFQEEIISYFDKEFSKNNKNYDVIFENIKKKFRPRSIINLYNHILANYNDVQLLDKTIRLINEKKYLDNLNSLIDFILKPSKDNSFANLKVLAIKIISNYKNKNALNALLFCLNDKNSNYKIRLAAAEALGKIGDNRAFSTLEKIAQDEEEKSTYVKESAVIALGMLGDRRALDVFNSILKTKEIFHEKFTYLKESIVEAISKFDISKDKKAYEILYTSLFDKNPKIRIATIETLMNSQISNNYDLIYERLKNDIDIEVKKNALVALYNLSDSKILKEVIDGQFENELKDYAREIYEEYE